MIRGQRPTRSSNHVEGAVPLESVLYTEELRLRPPRPPDHATENDVLVSLTRSLAESPEKILHTTAEKMLHALRCGSAGFSLLSEDGKRFDWVAIAGAWKSYVGRGTPRDFGPSGDVLARNAPLLFRGWEQRYAYMPTTPPAVEALIAPLVHNGKGAGTIWAIAHDSGPDARRFDAEDLRLVESVGRFAAAAHHAVERVRERESHRASLELMKGALHARQASERLNERLRESEARLAAELEAARALQEVSTRLVLQNDPDTLYREILDAAIAVMGSDMASIQKVDEQGDGLKLLAFRGFEPDFGEKFARCDRDTRTSCTVAWRTARRVIVPDTGTCDFIVGTPSAEDHHKAGIRAVQSTPLMSRTGMVLGILSTHWREPHEPSTRELRLLDVLARQAADLIERVSAETRERELRAAAEQANETKAAFLATMSHELRTPLNSIVGFSELLGLEIPGALNDVQKRHVAGIEMSAQHILQIIQEILLFSRIEAGREVVKPETVDVAELARAAFQLVEPLATRKGLEFRCVAPDRLEARTDAGKVRQILLNLLGNAIKFTDRGEVCLELVSDGTQAALTVSDTGVGIPYEHRGKVFEPFARGPQQDRPKEGAGLGLSVTERLARLLGGRISFESEPGRGSSFTVSLPLNPRSRDTGGPIAPKWAAEGAGPGPKRKRRAKKRAEDGA